MNKMKSKKTIVLSLGGSLIVPDKIDIAFLRNFKKSILDFVKKGNRAIIVCGGGGTNREYNSAAKHISNPSPADLDWLGIAATKINAELVRVIFGSHAYAHVVFNPNKKIKTSEKIIVASGWMPGRSSDDDAVRLAINFKADKVVNLTNVDYVYDKDPKKYKDAKSIKQLSWSKYLSIVGKNWNPRMHVPFDPTATRLAMSKSVRVMIVNGQKPENIRNILQGKKVKGTIIG